ncbi:hypothetical protein F6P96_08145 [Escherichia coli]|nr:hypothetical protein F6P96_08145 [Escherichia coli]
MLMPIAEAPDSPFSVISANGTVYRSESAVNAEPVLPIAERRNLLKLAFCRADKTFARIRRNASDA